MKKLISIGLVVLTLCCMAVPAFATSKSAIMSAIEAGVTVDGKVIHTPQNYIAMAQNYLDSHNLSSAQLDRIMAAIQTEKAKVAKQLAAQGVVSSRGNTSCPTSSIAGGKSNSSRPAESHTTSSALSSAVDSGTSLADSTTGALNDAITKSLGKNADKLTSQQKLVLGAAVANVVNASGAKITLLGQDVAIVDKDGNVYTTDQIQPIKDTGVAYNFIPLFMILAVMGVVLVSAGIAVVKTQKVGSRAEKEEPRL